MNTIINKEMLLNSATKFEPKRLFTLKVQFLCLLLFAIQLAHAGGFDQIVVDSTSDQPAQGLTTFREAIEESNLSGPFELVFDDEVFNSPQVITLENGEILITESIFITGPGAELLTIDADNQSRVFNINDNTQSAKLIDITGITFANGFSEGKGGCIKSEEKLKFRASVITGCTSASDGGGLSTVKNGNLIESSMFINNTARKGGGLAHQSGGAGDNLVIGSTFTGNNAINRGGGIFIFQTNGYQITNSTFSNNMAADGAGVRLNSMAIIKNSTFVDNLGVGVSIKQNIIENSIIAGNTGGDCVFQETGFSNQNNLDTDGSCGEGAVNHITVTNPMLEPLAHYGGLTLTHRPLPGSPVVDAGDDLFCEAFDQRGESRPQDGNADNNPVCDIGAVELAEVEDIPQILIFKGSFD